MVLASIGAGTFLLSLACGSIFTSKREDPAAVFSFSKIYCNNNQPTIINQKYKEY